MKLIRIQATPKPSISRQSITTTPVPENQLVYIHIMCHSHDDVGWIMSADQYYDQRVDSIISTVIEALLKDKKRRLSQTEIYFFQKWWEKQSFLKQNYVKQLVKEGRLKFINGGMDSNDEACPTYEEIIMNMMAGHEFLKRNFNISTKIAWHADQFGHSAATVDIVANMGFEAVFFGRINDEGKTHRKEQKTLEFIWQPTFLGPQGLQYSQNTIFTHIMHEYYMGPCNLDFWNQANARSQSQVESINQQKLQETRSKDFSFQFGEQFFSYLEQCIQIINNHPYGKRFVFKYSTLSDYLNAIIIYKFI